MTVTAESNSSVLIIVQRDPTQSSLFVILQVQSTCFGCQPHPSSGVHKTVTTASGTVQQPPSNVAKLATLEGGSCTKNMTSTGGCSYSIVYSWWWVWLTPETCRVNCLVMLEGGSCTVPEVVVTILCTPDDGCGWHPKHVKWTAWSCWREVAAQYRRL